MVISRTHARAITQTNEDDLRLRGQRREGGGGKKPEWENLGRWRHAAVADRCSRVRLAAQRSRLDRNDRFTTSLCRRHAHRRHGRQLEWSSILHRRQTHVRVPIPNSQGAGSGQQKWNLRSIAIHVQGHTASRRILPDIPRQKYERHLAIISYCAQTQQITSQFGASYRVRSLLSTVSVHSLNLSAPKVRCV